MSQVLGFDEAVLDFYGDDEAMADFGGDDEHAVEQAQGLLSSIMDANTPIETVEIDMYESMDVPNDKVLLDMTSVVPFVLHIGAWAELMQSVLDSQTNKHVIKLGFPACFVWKHDGAYLSSFGGLIGPLFTPYIPSRDYTREEIKSRCGDKLVFFRFEDNAPA